MLEIEEIDLHQIEMCWQMGVSSEYLSCLRVEIRK